MGGVATANHCVETPARLLGKTEKKNLLRKKRPNFIFTKKKMKMASRAPPRRPAPAPQGVTGFFFFYRVFFFIISSVSFLLFLWHSARSVSLIFICLLGSPGLDDVFISFVNIIK